MVKLPFQREDCGIKVVRRYHSIARHGRFRQVDCRGCLGTAGGHGPAIFPFHRDQVRQTANRTGVTEQQGIPLVIGRIKNTTLCYTVVGQKVPSAISREQILRTVNNFATTFAGRPRNSKQVILPVHLFHVRAFLLNIVISLRTRLSGHLVDTHAAEFATLAALFDAAGIVVQLHVADLVSAAVKNPGSTVVIEKQRRIVVKRKMNFGPRAIFHIGSLVKVGRHCRIRRSQYIEIAIPITDA